MSRHVVFEAVFHCDNVCPLLWYLSTDGILNSLIPSVLNGIDLDAARLDSLQIHRCHCSSLKSKDAETVILSFTGTVMTVFLCYQTCCLYTSAHFQVSVDLPS